MAYVTRSPAVDAVAVKQAAAPGWFVVRFLRGHPLIGFFLLALGFSWAWQIPMFAFTHQQILGPWVILGPSLAAFVMAAVTEGRGGMVKLFRRVLIWRFALRWYAIALLALPAIWLAGVALMPGSLAAFRMPSASFVFTYLGAFGFAFLSSFFVEEFGWRGFALPRLQLRHGPLIGTLILGPIWALWHLPSWAFFPSATSAGSSVFSFTFATTFLVFAAEITASAIVITWLFNHSRGSVLLAILFHATSNATGNSFLTLFPSQFPHPVIPTAFEIGVIVVALVIVVATRGRLGYDRHQADTFAPAAAPGAQPAPVPAATKPSPRKMDAGVRSLLGPGDGDHLPDIQARDSPVVCEVADIDRAVYMMDSARRSITARSRAVGRDVRRRPPKDRLSEVPR